MRVSFAGVAVASFDRVRVEVELEPVAFTDTTCGTDRDIGPADGVTGEAGRNGPVAACKSAVSTVKWRWSTR